jgi:hypothetical protein
MYGVGGIAPPFLRHTLNGGEWSVLIQGREPSLPVRQGADWASELIWIVWSRGKYIFPPWNQIVAIQPVAIPTEVSWIIVHELYLD